MCHTGLVAPRHVGSSQTRAQTRVSCTGRWILNRCATREALSLILATVIPTEIMWSLRTIHFQETENNSKQHKQIKATGSHNSKGQGWVSDLKTLDPGLR